MFFIERTFSHSFEIIVNLKFIQFGSEQRQWRAGAFIVKVACRVKINTAWTTTKKIFQLF